MPSISELPTPPTRSDPANFAARGDAFVSALPTFVSEVNALAATLGVFSGTKLYLNDTSNASMSYGWTLNQAATDDEILAFKSSDVAHGITTVTETDTYGRFLKVSGNDGGLAVYGLSDVTTGLGLVGIHATDDTTKSTAGRAVLQVDAYLKSGTTVTACGANANLFSIRNNGLMRLALDSEGDLHLDATSNINVWDDHDDVALLNSFRALTTPDQDFAKRVFGGWIQEHADILHRTGVVTITDHEDGKRDIFMSIKGLSGLMIDAIRQLGARVAAHDRLLEVR